MVPIKLLGRLLCACVLAGIALFVIQPNDLFTWFVTGLIAVPIAGICLLVTRQNARLCACAAVWSCLGIMCTLFFCASVTHYDGPYEFLIKLIMGAIVGWTYSVVNGRDWFFNGASASIARKPLSDGNNTEEFDVIAKL